MNRLRGFFVFLYDFIVGDDWRMTVAVIIGLATPALLAHQGLQWWFILPIFVVAGLAWSLRRAVARSS